MKTQSLARTGRVPALFDDFFRPWNEWFNSDAVMLDVPAVNVTESDKNYEVSLAAPGMKKDDFKIDVDGNLLTISSEKEHREEEDSKKFTRKEYSYSSFSRSFNLPDEVDREKIEALYTDGILQILLPRTHNGKKASAKTITVK